MIQIIRTRWNIKPKCDQKRVFIFYLKNGLTSYVGTLHGAVWWTREIIIIEIFSSGYFEIGGHKWFSKYSPNDHTVIVISSNGNSYVFEEISALLLKKSKF